MFYTPFLVPLLWCSYALGCQVTKFKCSVYASIYCRIDNNATLYLVHFKTGACGGGILLSLADPEQEGGKKCVIKAAEHKAWQRGLKIHRLDAFMDEKQHH